MSKIVYIINKEESITFRKPKSKLQIDQWLKKMEKEPFNENDTNLYDITVID